MRILLIEPDIILGNVYVRTLRRHGYEVSHVRSAQGAIAAADTHKPDLVILEMQLAAHSGAAFLYEFRSYTDWMDIPIVVHTLVPPDGLQVFAQTFYELGVRMTLYKPQTSLRKLLAVVEEFVPEVA